MSVTYSFGGLGNLFTCVNCGCSQFIRAENVKPEKVEVYECVNCHEWYTANVSPNSYQQEMTSSSPAVTEEEQVVTE